MKRPIIGLVPLYDEFKESIWMLPGYMEVLEKCGAIPIILPLSSDREELEQVSEICDGLLLTGGHDVSPAVYGEQTLPECGTPCALRDEMEGILLDLFLSMDKPVFGICRGIQFMNAYLGGSLYQDLPTQKPSSTEHHMSSPYDREIHTVVVYENTPLADIIGAGKHGVNSYHHQAIKELSPQLSCMAVSEDGLVEAVYVPDKKYAMAVQWHPEFSFLTDERSCKIMQSFVDACR